MSPITILIIGGSLAFVLLIAGVFVTVRSDQSRLEDRLEKYLEVPQQELEFGESDVNTPLTDWINTRVEKSSYGDRISRMLARADLKFRPGEYVALVIISMFVVALIAWYIGGKSYFLGIVGIIVGYFVPGFFVKRAQEKRLKSFGGQLPDMLGLMVNGLRAGFSTMQALEAVSKELPPPISDEFRRVVQEMQLGVPMEKALDNLLTRIPSEDLDLTITAINVQREVGGNLAEILETITHTIRERIRIKGEIKALTAQVMYSGKFLAMMPIILSLILYLLNKNYMMQFFMEPMACGVGMLVVAALMIMLGYYIMNKIADIEV